MHTDVLPTVPKLGSSHDASFALFTSAGTIRRPCIRFLRTGKITPSAEASMGWWVGKPIAKPLPALVTTQTAAAAA